MEANVYKNGQYYSFDDDPKIKQILDDMWDERIREEILKEIKPLDNDLLEKITGLAYFEEFISGDLLEKAWKMPWGWGKSEDFKPILVTYGRNLDILNGNSRIERDSELFEEIMALHCWNL